MLNNKYPKILTHTSVFKKENFFGSSHYVVDQNLKLFPNKCPHRGNKIISPGATKKEFKCGLHGWQWSSDGSPLNNNVTLKPKKASTNKSGLVFLDWEEPIDTQWVNDLSNDTLEYSHSTKKQGLGDWRWQMEMHVDLLHVEQIHPLLHSYVDCNTLKTEYGSDWICQYHNYGWWLFIYPFTHIEWEPGCLYLSEMTPKENDQGYDVHIHYLFNPNVDTKTKEHFIMMAETTFDEDITAVNEISANSKYREPNSNANHKLEKDIHHFYKWLEEHTE